MCLAVWLWDSHPYYALLLASNRDEFLARPTSPAHFWTDNPDLLAGRDEEKGGTWLGVTKLGRLALLTNFRDQHVVSGGLSRGKLTTDFLMGNMSPSAFVNNLASTSSQYEGFNLIVLDIVSKDMAFFSNRSTEGVGVFHHKVSSGLHGMSNGTLESQWPKVVRAKEKLSALVGRYSHVGVPPDEVVGEVLRDSCEASEETLPATGVALEWERALSPVFVQYESPMGRYATRSSTVLGITKEGQVDFTEHYWESGEWKKHEFTFNLHLDKCVGSEA